MADRPIAAADILAYKECRSQLPAPSLRKAIRESNNVSLRQMAEALGVSANAVWLWETGRRTPRAEHLVSYVELLQELGR